LGALEAVPASSNIRTAGFSLVEVMMVMLIIGLVSGAVVLTMSPPQAPEQVLAAKLARHLNGLAQNSLLANTPAAVGFSRAGYALFTYQEHKWRQSKAGEWPARVSVRFLHDGIALDLPESVKPLVFFEPTGLSSAFTLELEGRKAQFILYSHGDGQVLLKEVSL